MGDLRLKPTALRITTQASVSVSVAIGLISCISYRVSVVASRAEAGLYATRCGTDLLHRRKEEAIASSPGGIAGAVTNIVLIARGCERGIVAERWIIRNEAASVGGWRVVRVRHRVSASLPCRAVRQRTAKRARAIRVATIPFVAHLSIVTTEVVVVMGGTLIIAAEFVVSAAVVAATERTIRATLVQFRTAVLPTVAAAVVSERTTSAGLVGATVPATARAHTADRPAAAFRARRHRPAAADLPQGSGHNLPPRHRGRLTARPLQRVNRPGAALQTAGGVRAYPRGGWRGGPSSPGGAYRVGPPPRARRCLPPTHSRRAA